MNDLVPTNGTDRTPAAAPAGAHDVARRLRLRKLQAQHERDVSTFVKDYLRIIWRRRWLIAAFTVVVATFVLVMTLQSTPYYRATARIGIDIGGSSALPQADYTMNYLRHRDYLAKQIEQLRSPQTARAVIENLNLAQHELFRNRYASVESHNQMLAAQRSTWEFALRELFGTEPLPPPGPGETPDHRTDRKMVGLFRSLVTITQDVQNENIVTLTCVSPYPDLASQIPNGLAETFARMKKDDARQTVDNDRQFLEDKLEETDREIADAQRAIQQYSEREGFLALDKQIAEATRAITAYEDQRVAAQKTLLETTARLEQVRANPEKALAVRGDVGVRRITDDISDLERQYAELTQLYKDEYPAVADVLQQLEKLKAQRDSAIETAVASLELELASARKSLANIDQEITARYEFYDQIESKYREHERLRERLQSANTKRQTLLESFGMTSLRQGITPVEVSVIQQAETPLSPFYPNTKRYLLIGVLAGLVVGTVFSLILDFMDNTVKSGEEVEDMLGLPALATIPLDERSSKVKKRRIITPGQKRIETVSHHEPRGPHAERFRFLRTAITYSTPGGKPHVIGFSSCLPREGKTTCSINTAITFAKRGLKVVLIDADLKKPMIHRHFMLERQVGLTTVLTDNADLDDVIQASAVPNLDVITAGHLPPNPTDLIESEAMKRVIEQLKERYDLVIFDSAPLYNIPDTNVLATHLEGLILVVRAGATPREVLKDIHDQLDALNIRMMGVVVNGVVTSKAGRYGYKYRYSYAYNYGYGYGYGYQYGGFKSEQPVKMRDKKAGEGEEPVALPVGGGGEDSNDTESTKPM